MGLYFLNISVDAADPNPEHIPEDLSINDQESIIEIVVEKILGYEDAIKEYDDHDPDDHNTQTNVKIDLINRCSNDINIEHLFVESVKQKFPDFKTYLTIGFYRLFSPPPEI